MRMINHQKTTAFVASLAVTTFLLAGNGLCADKLIVKDELGMTTFSVQDDGGVLAKGVSIIGSQSSDPTAATLPFRFYVSDDSSFFTGITTSGAQATRYHYLPAGCPNWISHRARGSSATSLEVVKDGDMLGRFFFRGYSEAAANYLNTGWIGMLIDGEPDTGGDTTDMPGKIVFYTAQDGTNVPVERMVVKNDGKVGIGTQTPNSELHVDGYIQLGTSSGTPPGADCAGSDDYGRMKVDPDSSTLWICTSIGWDEK
jgi:hypothetical protein